MIIDPISDMLTRIRNASQARKAEAIIPFSKIKWEIARLLLQEGYVRGAEKILLEKESIKIQLGYDNSAPLITALNRISKPGRRLYVGYDKIKPIKNGLGVAFLSTPEGLMTSKEAKKKKVGGEIICEVY
ncbi:MAG: 30S ribosomal protein S8 [Candidatus Magasanikbacteria bacterium]|nr:30S ribosomal protein S8 [Candidatus Magasanikbacteria bacterium]